MNDETATPPPVKRGPGRPRKNPVLDRSGMERPPITSQMKAKPNWVSVNAEDEDTPDRLHIPKELIPEGMDLLWVTEAVYGQGMPQHRAKFERKGWTPVHQSDFDGRFDGRFMPKGRDGEINVDGSAVLMARPKELSIRAKNKDRREALEAVAIKEQALRGGDLPVTLDSQHPTALKMNRINKTIERIDIPD